MSSGKRYTPEEKGEIMQYRQTHTYQETADKYGVSQMTLARWSRLQKDKVIITNRLSGDPAYAGALQALKYLEGMKAAALYSDAGEVVSTISDSTLYEDALFTPTVALLAAADRFAQEVDIGRLEMVLTKCAGGLLFMLEAGPRSLLVLLYGGSVDVRKIVVQDLPFIDRVRQDIRSQSEKETNQR
ncbi:MAG: roadblock/LC7 domain-containing protein [Candidatus Lokiarchaeota archaeon]|nr:roadblock/LC7 domain-containing protein [Candidatus Lokiarchaeota archaeon]